MYHRPHFLEQERAMIKTDTYLQKRPSMDFQTKPLVNVKNLWNSETLWGYLYAVFAWMVSFVAPVWPFVGLAVALVVADMWTGIRKAVHLGDKISSKGFRRTIEKILLYFIAILLSEQMRITFFPAVPLTYLTALGICLTEFKSMIENVEVVTGVNIWSNISGRLFPPKK